MIWHVGLSQQVRTRSEWNAVALKSVSAGGSSASAADASAAAAAVSAAAPLHLMQNKEICFHSNATRVFLCIHVCVRDETGSTSQLTPALGSAWPNRWRSASKSPGQTRQTQRWVTGTRLPSRPFLLRWLFFIKYYNRRSAIIFCLRVISEG